MKYCPVCGPIRVMRNHILLAHTCRCEEEDTNFRLVRYTGVLWVMCQHCGAYWPLPMSFIPVDVNA